MAGDKSKDFVGYKIMKQIMHDHSSGKSEGIVNFEYNPADVRQPLLFEFLRPVGDLGAMLLNDFAGRTLGVEEIYEKHSVGRPFVLKHYREALCELEQRNAVTMSRPSPPRRKGTLAPSVMITFPAR